jgi:hypothetical protein
MKTYMGGMPNIYKSPLGRNQSPSLGKKLRVQRRPQRTLYPQEESLQHFAVDHITGVNASRGPIQSRLAATRTNTRTPCRELHREKAT